MTTPNKIIYISIYICCISLFSGCAHVAETGPVCPEFGKYCHQVAINTWNYKDGA